MMRIPEPLRLALLAYAERIMDERPPDFILNGYMDRWFFAERGQKCNIYLHRFRGNDSDRALHDHPFDSVSTILKGSYIEFFHWEPLEIMPDGKYLTLPFVRFQGEVIERPAATMHRVGGIKPGQEVISLFAVGERIRDWGFLDPIRGWVQWQEYERAYAIAPSKPGLIGKTASQVIVDEPTITQEKRCIVDGGVLCKNTCLQQGFCTWQPENVEQPETVEQETQELKAISENIANVFDKMVEEEKKVDQAIARSETNILRGARPAGKRFKL